MAYILIGIAAAVAVVIVSWVQVKADQERAECGEPKKHNEQIITVIGFSERKD
ncbi:MAG: hypothetical protein IJ523_10680 [Succinivibrionaceae bacterium]|nr:hypothetical protein [Succinivibrionaceae bacterium]